MQTVALNAFQRQRHRLIAEVAAGLRHGDGQRISFSAGQNRIAAGKHQRFAESITGIVAHRNLERIRRRMQPQIRLAVVFHHRFHAPVFAHILRDGRLRKLHLFDLENGRRLHPHFAGAAVIGVVFHRLAGGNIEPFGKTGNRCDAARRARARDTESQMPRGMAVEPNAAFIQRRWRINRVFRGDILAADDKTNIGFARIQIHIDRRRAGVFYRHLHGPPPRCTRHAGRDLAL
ncbi:MAG: hypothetical protein ALAOOOJD_01030 [bacterium]|nr:hypothetical protein [bacterium]